MTKKTQGNDAVRTSLRPIPGRRRRVVFSALAIIAGLAIGSGVAFAVTSAQQDTRREQSERVAAAVAAFTSQAGVTNGAFDALSSHIDEGNTVLNSVEADGVEPEAIDSLTVAVTDAEDFTDDHWNRPETAEGLEPDDVDALTTELAGLADSADEYSVAIVDAVETVDEVVLKSAVDDLGAATKDLTADLKKAEKVLESSEGKVLNNDGRTELSDEIDAAKNVTADKVNQNDLDELLAATKAHEKASKLVVKARKVVSKDVEAYEEELRRQAEIEAAIPDPPVYVPPAQEPEPEQPDPDPTESDEPEPDEPDESDEPESDPTTDETDESESTPEPTETD